MEYLEFDITIDRIDDTDYMVKVINSPAGQASEILTLPFTEAELHERQQSLQIALLRSSGRRRRILGSEERAVQDFGQELFDTLFCGDVRTRHDISRHEATCQEKGLRLKMRVQPAELANLPWEFIYDSCRQEYTGLSRNSPVVRYLETHQPVQPLVTQLPLRILGFVASPGDLEPIDSDREKRRMEQAIEPLRLRGLVELTWVEGQTWRDLHKALQCGPWHAFHFCGHGRFDAHTDEGQLALADEQGMACFMSATQLGRLLADHSSMRLVLLNSCDGARSSDQDVFSSSPPRLCGEVSMQ